MSRYAPADAIGKVTKVTNSEFISSLTTSTESKKSNTKTSKQKTSSSKNKKKV